MKNAGDAQNAIDQLNQTELNELVVMVKAIPESTEQKTFF
jgi:hypothetical protein